MDGSGRPEAGEGLARSVGAWVGRVRSGKGRYLDITLHGCGMALPHPRAANHFLDGRRKLGYPEADADKLVADGVLHTRRRI
jgi:formyl-CoA transferase